MFEVYLVAQERSTALVDEKRVKLEAGSVLVVELGELVGWVKAGFCRNPTPG